MKPICVSFRISAENSIDRVPKEYRTCKPNHYLNHLENYTVAVVNGDRRGDSRNSVINAETGDESFAKPFDYAGTKSFGGPGMYAAYAETMDPLRC